MRSTQKISSETALLPAESVHPTLAIASLGIGTFAQVTCEFLPVGLLPHVADNFGISQGQAGLMMTIPGILAGLAAALIAAVAGTTDRRNILLLLATLLTLSSIGSAIAPTFELLLAARALLGVSLGASWAMSLSAAGRVVSPAKVHKSAAAVFAGVTAAMIFGLPLGSLIADLSSWRYAFASGACFGALALLMQALYLPRLPATNRFKLSQLLAFFRQPSAQASLAMVFLVHAAHFGAYTFLAPALSDVGITGGSLTLLLFVFGIIGFASNFLASALVKGLLRKTLLGAQLLLGGVLALMLATDLPLLRITAMLGWGVAWGALPLALNMWNRTVPHGGGEAGSALFIITAQTAIAFGSYIGGNVYDTTGLGASFELTAGLALCSAAVLLAVASRIKH